MVYDAPHIVSTKSLLSSYGSCSVHEKLFKIEMMQNVLCSNCLLNSIKGFSSQRIAYNPIRGYATIQFSYDTFPFCFLNFASKIRQTKKRNSVFQPFIGRVVHPSRN